MDNVDNPIIEHLRAMRTDIATIKDDVRELKHRTTGLEHRQGTVIQRLGHLASMLAVQQTSHDKLLERGERMEKRLELTT